MKPDLTHEEACALRLIRLIMSPNKKFHMKTIGSSIDGFGHKYSDLLSNLHAKTYIHLEGNSIELLS